MHTCPSCDRRVDRLHALPPGVVTRELIEALGGVEAPTDLETCGDCLDEFMRGTGIT